MTAKKLAMSAELFVPAISFNEKWGTTLTTRNKAKTMFETGPYYEQ